MMLVWKMLGLMGLRMISVLFMVCTMVGGCDRVLFELVHGYYDVDDRV